MNLSAAADITTYTITGTQSSVNLIPLREHIMVQLPDNVLSGNDLVAGFTLSDGAQARINNTVQVSGVTKNNFTSDIDYVVSAANHTEKKWTVTVTNNDHSYDWGLGHFMNLSVNNNRDYEWYYDQGQTGAASLVNCGPTSVTMAIKWADSGFSKTPADARNTYYENGGWWTTDDINWYLNNYSIPHAIIPLGSSAMLSQKIIRSQLDSNRIIILCIDMNYIRSSDNTLFRTNKFYSTTPNWGHFFVVKGYQQVDDIFYFQIYDPYSLGLTNSDDGTPKGRNRFYHYEDVFDATYNWWKYAIVIAQKGQTLDINTLQKAVNPSDIKPGTSAKSF